MKKYMDKIKQKLYFNENLFVFLIVLVLVGVGAGTLFSILLKESDKSLVTEYLNNFIDNISKNSVNFNISFINNVIFTLGFALLIWVFGISIIGVFFVLPFLFFKSFVLGFSVGSILINFKFKGILLALVYIVPHHVINILIYILVSAFSIMISYRLFDSMKCKKNFDFKIFMNKYLFVLGFCLIVLFFSSCYEVFALPRVMNFLVNLLK